MKKPFILLLLLNFIAIVPQARAVSEAAVLFLLIQPSLHANGMGGASVASSEPGALSVAFNPAHIGLATFNSSVHVEFYPSKVKWLPGFNLDDLYFDAKSFLFGYNFKRLNKHIPVSFGVGYTRIFINLGEQIITGETGPEPIGVFNSSEHADIWTFGIGIDYFVKVGVGLNFKNIESNLAAVGVGAEKGFGSAKANAHDFGVIMHLPIVETLSKLSHKSFEFYPDFRPFLMPGFGYSKSNIGDEITYIDPAQADPLPRVARMAFSVNAGILYSNANIDLSILAFEWTSEAEDLLVERNEDGSFQYEGGLGDINFFKNVVGGEANENIISSQGWEMKFVGLYSIRRGRLKDPDGKRFYDTKGWGLSFSGAVKLVRMLSPELKNDPILTFLSQHLDIQYNSSSFDVVEGQLLAGTKFKGLSISFF
ncbi:MAG: hypothetical protein ACE5HI_14240 [bacterium]